MKLAGLHIDRFGIREGLDLADIADQLNVVYGPNGAGKTTVIQFIRWMIYGDRDEISRRYLTTNGAPASGTMIVEQGSARRTLRRTSQLGSELSELTIDSGTQPIAGVPIGISSSEFDRHFMLSFDQPRNLSDLFSSAAAHGLQLQVDDRQVERVRQLTELLERHRADLARMGIYDSVESLRSQRAAKVREIETIRLEWQNRRAQLQQQRDELDELISGHQATTNRLKHVVENIEAAIENRKQQLAKEYREWLLARREAEDRRLSRFTEIDAQISRWKEMLTDVRSRLDMVRTHAASLDSASLLAAESTDLQHFVRRLGFRLRDFEHEVAGVYSSDSWRDYRADADYLRGLLGSALNSVQNDVNQLYQTVESQEQANELLETREELSYLVRVERELTELIDGLGRRRIQLGRDASYDSRFTDVNATNDGFFDDLLSASPQEMATMLEDFRLRHLVDRREAATARYSDAARELTHTEHRLRNVDQQLAQFGKDGQIELLQREIARIDEQLRDIDQRLKLEATIASLEEELRQARMYGGQSNIIQEASSILRRLTNDEYQTIRVSSGHQCTVAKSQWLGDRFYTFSELSQGLKDLVYLSVSLAIVNAYRARNVVAPLILNDVFVNLDNAAAQSLVGVLCDFASRGQQMLLFTRHQHIRDLFGHRAARMFTLRDVEPAYRPEPAPVAPPTQTPLPPQMPDYVPAVEPMADRSPAPRDPSYQWVAEWHRKDPVHTFPAPIIKPQPVERPEPIEKGDDDPSDDEKLQLTDSLTVPSIISDELARCLQTINIHTIGEFLERDPDVVASELDAHGVTAEIIQRRQRELLMMVYIGASVLDAQLLVACGVPDPARLGRADDIVLLKRIETILDRPQAAQRFGAFSEYSLARVRRWIKRAQKSGYRGKSRRNFGSTQPSSYSTQPSSTRGAVRHNLAEPAATVKINVNSALRFYLEVNDPVVDAPEIGPKTAERLNAVDIYTVAHLLEADPATLAAKLDDRRINRDTIEQWQSQAQLVCRIPNLRGHDAQIIVACGVDDPVTLSSLDPVSFLETVTAFVDSKEGQRVVRNGKLPDLAEVTAWIEWAASARQLRAA